MSVQRQPQIPLPSILVDDREWVYLHPKIIGAAVPNMGSCGSHLLPMIHRDDYKHIISVIFLLPLFIDC